MAHYQTLSCLLLAGTFAFASSNNRLAQTPTAQTSEASPKNRPLVYLPDGKTESPDARVEWHIGKVSRIETEPEYRPDPFNEKPAFINRTFLFKNSSPDTIVIDRSDSEWPCFPHYIYVEGEEELSVFPVVCPSGKTVKIVVGFNGTLVPPSKIEDDLVFRDIDKKVLCSIHLTAETTGGIIWPKEHEVFPDVAYPKGIVRDIRVKILKGIPSFIPMGEPMVFRATNGLVTVEKITAINPDPWVKIDGNHIYLADEYKNLTRDLTLILRVRIKDGAPVGKMTTYLEPIIPRTPNLSLLAEAGVILTANITGNLQRNAQRTMYGSVSEVWRNTGIRVSSKTPFKLADLTLKNNNPRLQFRLEGAMQFNKPVAILWVKSTPQFVKGSIQGFVEVHNKQTKEYIRQQYIFEAGKP